MRIKNVLSSSFFVLTAICGLFMLRTWPRLKNPEVWDEDGTRNIAGYLQSGFADLIDPVNGYIIVIPKLITIAALSLSPVYYPAVSTAITFGFTVAVLFLISKAPIHLNGKFLLAFFCLLVPTDPENFGLPLYTFWWSALVLFIFVFWKDSAAHVWARATGIALGSLSSPVCLVTLPLFWSRVIPMQGRGNELALAWVATFAAGLQVYFMWPIAKGGQLDWFKLHEVVPVFLGNFLVGNISPKKVWFFGLLILTYVLIGFFRHRRSWVLWGLGYLWAASVLMSITRVDMGLIHPTAAGPRYFFFPFIVLSWTLLQLAWIDKSWWMKTPGIFFLSLSVANAIPFLTRQHDALGWSDHLASCAQFSEYKMPIHFDGVAVKAWSVDLKGSVCKNLIEKDYFGRDLLLKTYPYKISGKLQEMNLQNLKIPDISRVQNPEVQGADYFSKVSGKSSAPKGYQIYGTYKSSNADVGSIEFTLHRGETILFRSESLTGHQFISIEGHDKIFLNKAPVGDDWMAIEFSNRLLPDTFKVKVSDRGDGGGAWSAVAFTKSP